MPTKYVTAPIPSSGISLRGRLNKVLENRDLCRIVVNYIPNDKSLAFEEEEEKEEKEDDNLEW